MNIINRYLSYVVSPHPSPTCVCVCVCASTEQDVDRTLSTHSAITYDNVRLDIAASGFWGGRFEMAFLM